MKMHDNIDNKSESIDNAVWSLLRKKHNTSKLESLLKLYIYAGLLAGAVGLVYFFILTVNITMDNTQRKLLLIIGTSLGLSILSFGALRLIRMTRDKRIYMAIAIAKYADFLRYLQTFEEVARDLLDKLNIEYERNSFREMTRALVLYKIIKVDELELLERSLQIRDLLLYESDQLPADYIASFAAKLEILIARMQERMRS